MTQPTPPQQHSFGADAFDEILTPRLPAESAPMPRGSMINLISQNPRLAPLLEIIKRSMISDPSHDIEHLLRVARWTCFIVIRESEREPEKQATLAIGASLLHDLINLPKSHPERAHASSLSAEQASEYYLEVGFSQEEAADMAGAIRTHSYSRGERPTTLLGKALQDADRLDAIGALGVLRCISVAAQMNSSLFDSSDPWASTRELDDKKFAVDHFFTKLFKLTSGMNTDTARTEANKRARTMALVLNSLGEEIGCHTPNSLIGQFLN